ncbi:MAG: PAS domain-containing protein, partial [Candidatus Cloacimonetes bacterium]|nr:PAS domain-containing protein [Candidatus Cloacimonadota bacterium]
MQKKIALKITLIYFLLGVLWILSSDKLAIVASHWIPLTKIQTYKGLFYILISGIVVYLLIHRAYFKLQKKEREYTSLVQDQSDMIIRWKPEGVCLFANNAYLNFFGLKEDEVLGKDISIAY